MHCSGAGNAGLARFARHLESRPTERKRYAALQRRAIAPMKSNPYSSPATTSRTQHLSTDNRRPLGVSLVSALLIADGSIKFFYVVAIGTQWNAFASSAANRDASAAMLLTLMASLMVTAYAAAYGMFKRKKWGWVLASLYYGRAVVRDVTALVSAFIRDSIALTDIPDWARFIPKASICLLVFLYLFQPRVAHYFDLSRINTVTACKMLFAIYVVMTTILWLAPGLRP
jgi:hypothetical protein